MTASQHTPPPGNDDSHCHEGGPAIGRRRRGGPPECRVNERFYGYIQTLEMDENREPFRPASAPFPWERQWSRTVPPGYGIATRQ
jgi:hypothetical protein